MSVNIVNQDLSLNRLASNSSVTVKSREAVFGKIDVLFDGSKSGTGTVTLSKSYKDYDYLDFEFGSSSWLCINALRYSKDILGRSSSSAKLRYYINNSTQMQFYQTSNTEIYFAQNSVILRRVVGYKMGITDVYIQNPSQGDIYPYNSSTEVDTKGVWVDGRIIYRKCADKTLTSSVSSSFDIANVLGQKDIVNSRAFVISSSGVHYPLPYVDSSGNSTSYYIDEYGKITVVLKGHTWSSGTQFKFIIDYTKK